MRSRQKPQRPPSDEPAHHRDVVVPAQRALARRAMRGRERDRQVARQPVDADVEEAADEQPQHAEQHGRSTSGVIGWPSRAADRLCGSIGSGQSGDCRPTSTRPEVMSIDVRASRRVDGHVVSKPGCNSSSHDQGAVTPASARAGDERGAARRSGRAHRAGSSRRCASRRRPFVVGRLRQRAPQQPRRLPVAALGQRDGRERLHPPRRARYRGALREGVGGLRVVAGPPVVDEADVLEVLPAIGRRRDALLEQAHGEIGPARSTRWRFRQEDGAEAIGDDEARIQRRREVEERIQVLERARTRRPAAGSRRNAARRASSTGRRRACRTTARRGAPRPASADRAPLAVPGRDAAAATRPAGRIDAAAAGRGADQPRQPSRHLKSRRWKIATAIDSMAALYAMP